MSFFLDNLNLKMNYKIKHLVVCGIFFFGCLFAHPFHSSIISLKFNDNSRSIEITMRVFANDLEKTINQINDLNIIIDNDCLLYTSPSPRDLSTSRMPSSA